MHLLRLAYLTLFLIAVIAIFVGWSQVGGQGHLDLIPWFVKLGLGGGAAVAVTRAGIAAVESDGAWNGRTLRWTGILLALLVGCALATYYVHLYMEDESGDEDSQNVSSIWRGPSRVDA